MSASDFAQLALYVILLCALSPFLGRYLAAVFEGRRTFLSRLAMPLERATCILCGTTPDIEQNWVDYAFAVIAFNGVALILVIALLMLQGYLPLNPEHFRGLSPALAFNVAVSFVTNTNWQSYAGEATLSNFSQMSVLAVENFASAATGLAVAVAVVRGLVRRESKTIGNFYIDLLRGTLYLLLPLSLVFAVFLIWQGVPQNLHAFIHAHALEGTRQVIAQGPVASQEAIKQLGSNGGGFFNANSAHPYANPTPLSDFFEMLALLLIPASAVFMFGEMAHDRRQSYSIFAAMLVLFLVVLAFGLWAAHQPNPLLANHGINFASGNMEGKETRFGVTNSMLWATATTAASNGSVNAMLDSFMPLAGMIPLFNILLGEVVFGGVGAGLYGMLLFVLLALFIAGLMVGRTPEFLGKKIEAREIKWIVLAIVGMALALLGGTALACVTAAGRDGPLNSGPHGFSEILYAYASAVGNNGSAFAGLNANSTFYNLSLGVAMLIGRYIVIVPMLAIAGSMAMKKRIPESSATFPTYGLTFVVLLIGVVLIVGALTFFPALALGPIAEHFAMFRH